MTERSTTDSEHCPNCHLDEIDWSSGSVIPVWENIDDFNRGEPPDYAGCTICHTMRPVKEVSG